MGGWVVFEKVWRELEVGEEEEFRIVVRGRVGL